MTIRVFPLFLLGCMSLVVMAQPKSIGPEDVQRLLQRTHISDNWADTKAFDLDNPSQLAVKIQDVFLPESGYAELYYSLDLNPAYLRKMGLEPDAVYVATLQQTDAAKRLNLPLDMLRGGTKATLIGWHATASNYLSSSFLIDKLVLRGGDLQFALHENNPEMDKRKKQAEQSHNLGNAVD